MKSGETGYLKISINNLNEEVLEQVDEIIFSIKAMTHLVQKRYPSEVDYSEGYFYVPLTQKDTTELVGSYKAEAQIIFKDKSTSKSDIAPGTIDSSIYTEFVQGSTPGNREYASFSLEIEPVHIVMSGAGVSSYNQLTDKPSVNGVTLEGDLTSEDLHIGGGAIDDDTVSEDSTWSSQKINDEIANFNGGAIDDSLTDKYMVHAFGSQYQLSAANCMSVSTSVYIDTREQTRHGNAVLKISKTSETKSNWTRIKLPKTYPVTSAGKKIGAWIYVPLETYKNVQTIQFQFGIANAYGIVSKKNVSVFQTNMYAGWHFYEFELYGSEEYVCDGVAILFSDFTDTGASSHSAIEFYLGEFVEGYEMKPTILFAFDNSRDDNMYAVGFPIMNKYGLYGTFAYQNGANPDNVGANKSGVTREHLAEMKLKGWDVAQYDGINTSQTPDDIRAYNSLLKSQGINPVAYFPRFNDYAANNTYETLKELGFKVIRTANSNMYLKGQGCEVVPCATLSFEKDINAVKGYIDTAIANHHSLVIMVHQVVESKDTTSSNCLKTDFEAMCAYVREKIDDGSVQIMSFKELIDSNINDELYRRTLRT